MPKALKLTPEGEITLLELDSPIASTLTILQGAVEGLIEPVDINPDLTMYVNEEFLFSGKELNPLASAFIQRVQDNDQAFVLGNVIFTGGVGDEGETLGLDDYRIDMLTFLAVASTR